jgi:secondary thiamine-phosphate synthase enzyme
MSRVASVEQVAQNTWTVPTRGRGFTDITAQVDNLVAASGVQVGIANIFTAHTSCSLLISENADPAVRRDLERWFARAVPDGDALFEHDAEGPDDMPAHVRSALTGVTLTVPVSDGRLQLGTWQGIYLWEHRTRLHQRKVVVTVLGQ